MATDNFYRTPYLTTISFAAGVLLFLLPFVEIKCSGQTVAKMSGLDMVTGSSPKESNDLGLDRMTNPFDKGNDNPTLKTKTDKEGTTYTIALVVLVLGIGGVIISLLKKGGYNKLEIIVGITGAIALIILMIQVKNDVGDEVKSKSGGVDNFGGMTDISAEFTFWFYVCVLSYLAAAFFSYKQKDLVDNGEIPPVNAPQTPIKNPGDQSDFPAVASGDKDLG